MKIVHLIFKLEAETFPIDFGKIFFLFIFILCCSRVDLQCQVSFRRTAKWFSYTYTYIQFFFRFFFTTGTIWGILRPEMARSTLFFVKIILVTLHRVNKKQTWTSERPEIWQTVEHSDTIGYYHLLLVPLPIMYPTLGLSPSLPLFYKNVTPVHHLLILPSS